MHGNNFTTEEFKRRGTETHKGKYLYPNAIYIGIHTKVTITCQKHGNFDQSPSNHIHLKNGCPKCKGEGITTRLKSNTEEFKNKANIIHNFKYIYPKSEYEKNNKKIIITCLTHGDFSQTPASHLSGNGCPDCGRKNIADSLRLTKLEFTQKSGKKHEYIYDYSKSDYNGRDTKVIIICKTHGEFKQNPHAHMTGAKCPECNGGVPINKEKFVIKSDIVHKNKYNYDKSIFITTAIKVIITCPRHGDFTQTPSNHISGHGCPRCRESLGEKAINEFLTQNDIKFKPQGKFDTCRRKKALPFDFVIYHKNITSIIEFHGRQHYSPSAFRGTITKEQLEKNLLYIQECDNIKKKWCKAHNIPFLAISYKDKNYIPKIITEFLDKVDGNTIQPELVEYVPLRPRSLR